MHVLIMGSGGVGGFIGTRLQETGQEVTFVARGPHLHAIRDHGLCMLSETGTRQIHHVNAVERPADAGDQFDLVIFAVKCYDTQPAAELLRPAIGQQTAVLTLQNGIDSVPTLSSILGAQHIIGGATWLTAHIARTRRHRISGRRWSGPPSANPPARISNRVQAIAHALRACGIQTEVSDDIDYVLWNKLVLLSVLGAISAACQLPLGPILATEGMLDLFRTMFDEAVAVARSQGIAPPRLHQRRPHRPPSIPPARQHHLPPGRLRPPTPRRTRLHRRRRNPPRPRNPESPPPPSKPST